MGQNVDGATYSDTQVGEYSPTMHSRCFIPGTRQRDKGSHRWYKTCRPLLAVICLPSRSRAMLYCIVRDGFLLGGFHPRDLEPLALDRRWLPRLFAGLRVFLLFSFAVVHAPTGIMSRSTVAPPTFLQRNRRFRNQLPAASADIRCPVSPRRHRLSVLCKQESI